MDEGRIEDIPTLGGARWALSFVWSVFPVSGTRIFSGALPYGVAIVLMAIPVPVLLEWLVL